MLWERGKREARGVKRWSRGQVRRSRSSRVG